MRSRRWSLAFLGSWLAAAAGASGPPEEVAVPAIFRAEPLRVRFHDPYRLISEEVREQLQQEVTAAFERSGVGIRFVGAGGPGVIPATLYPEIPEHWRVPSEAIGVAIGADEERRSVFLSLGAAERALGRRRHRRVNPSRGNRGRRASLPAPQARRLGIALGRVLAHELTHSIAPDCPHTPTGLMAARLSRRMLTAPGVTFDELATRHLRQGAADLTRSRSGSG